MYRYYGFGISVLLVEVDTPVWIPEPTIKPSMIDTKRFMARYSKQTIAAVNVESTSRIIERYITSVAVGVRSYFRSMLSYVSFGAEVSSSNAETFMSATGTFIVVPYYHRCKCSWTNHATITNFGLFGSPDHRCRRHGITNSHICDDCRSRNRHDCCTVLPQRQMVVKEPHYHVRCNSWTNIRTTRWCKDVFG